MRSLWQTKAALALALAGAFGGARSTNADEQRLVVEPVQEYRLVEVAPEDARYYGQYYLLAQGAAATPPPEAAPATPVADAPPTPADDARPLSKYWLGIQLAEVPEILRKHLNLDGGVLIEDVFTDSPAAKAGFQQHDILVRSGDKAIKEPADIQKAVEEAKETELTVTVIRGGKEVTVKATPAKRPEPPTDVPVTTDQYVPAGSPELQGHIKQLEEALQGLKAKAGGDLGIWLARPGVVAPRATMARRAEFPKNLNVMIQKEGDKPAKIVVKRDDKEWTVTEDKLSELPDDVRPHVQQMLGRHAIQGLQFAVPQPRMPGVQGAYSRAVRVRPDGKVEGQIAVAPVPVPPPATSGAPYYNPATTPAPAQAKIHTYRAAVAGGAGIEAKLDAILRKLDSRNDGALEKLQDEVKQLRKELEELRGSKSDERK